ncbi:glycoside hydrolase family 43 protein [Lonepinella koalarum]|uniref:family 43 glycosylhydrolase n=1 Tax=Lonepinella koalarum TaxID=53417 RepID=UPI0011E40789|nr:family 43 glycosylhydrolase [Lonepinella koalarum]TYG34868.1 glycoside hydrolase family 43 protein [Lonepinella koalarum]
MGIIKNPILSGMAPDPSILRVGNDYFIATSTFHWRPAIQIFHSKDLANWLLYTYALKNHEINLRGTNTPAGIWAPHLSYDKKTQTYWLCYSFMNNMAGREFNGDSYVVWANDIKGPWSKPIYLTSVGFDPSLFHDDDGRHYLAILEWENRTGYQAPGTIVLSEIELSSYQKTAQIKGWKRITHGFTTRGCVEAPQIYKHKDYYYLLLASGGTGYGHGIEIGRAKNIFGPYEGNPTGEPIITSNPAHLFSLGDPDAGHFEMFNPNSEMQKAGHGSIVETPNGEIYIAHLMSRPLPNTILNPLGRETSLQKMVWTENDWLQLEDGSNLAKMVIPAPQNLAIIEQNHFDIEEYFGNNEIPLCFMTPYHQATEEWVDVNTKGEIKISGRGSLFSQVNPAILATRATSHHYFIETKLLFDPTHYSQSAGVGLYYDSNNWIFARLTTSYDETRTVLRLIKATLGEKEDFIYGEVEIPQKELALRLHYHYGKASIEYSVLNNPWKILAENIDVSYLSDEGVNGEPGEIGGFTGLFNFIGAVDTYQHDSWASFTYYLVKNS